MRELINLRKKEEFIVDRRNWGNEAKNGLSIYTRLIPLRCPNCRRMIDCRLLVHEKVKKGWDTFCRLCRPNLRAAASN